MEQGGAAIDKDRVLNVKPIRSLAPVFPPPSNFSSFATSQGTSHVYAPPSGPFPPGITPFYPFVGDVDLKIPCSVPLSTPISSAVQINSYRTPTTGASNGNAGSSKSTQRRRGLADEDGNGEVM